MKIRRGDRPAPLPADVPAGIAEGYRVKEFNSPEELDRWCRAWGVSAHSEFNRRRVEACLIRRLHTVALPTREVAGDEKYNDLSTHEYAHTWGYDHDENGENWRSPRTPVPAAAAWRMFGAR